MSKTDKKCKSSYSRKRREHKPQLSRQIGRSRRCRAFGSDVCLVALVDDEYASNGITFVMPPSTTKSDPLTKLLSSLARNSTAWACSIGSPKRPVGRCTSRRCRFSLSSPNQSCNSGVLSLSMVLS